MSATNQPTSACGPPSADISSGIVMNGPMPIMLAMLSAVACNRPKGRARGSGMDPIACAQELGDQNACGLRREQHEGSPDRSSGKPMRRIDQARTICAAASTIFGASGRSHSIIPAAPGPGTSGKAMRRALTFGTSCTTSERTCAPKPAV